MFLGIWRFCVLEEFKARKRADEPLVTSEPSRVLQAGLLETYLSGYKLNANQLRPNAICVELT